MFPSCPKIDFVMTGRRLMADRLFFFFVSILFRQTIVEVKSNVFLLIHPVKRV